MKTAVHAVKYGLYVAPIYGNLFLSRCLHIKSLRIPIFCPRRFGDNPFAVSFLFLWGISHTKKEYDLAKK